MAIKTMTTNLMELVKGKLSDTVMSQAANLIGESKSNTSSAISSFLPTILGSIVHKGSTEKGAAGIMDMINNDKHDGSIFDNLGDLMGGGEASTNFMKSGSSMISSILGNNQSTVLGKLSNLTGMSKNSSSSIMSLLAPMVMGMIGKVVKSEGMNVSSLMHLLKSQRSFLTDAMPSGIGNMFGLTNTTTSTKTTTATPVSNTTEETSGGGWWKWLVGAVLIGGLVWFFTSKTGTTENASTMSTTTENVGTTSSDNTMGTANTNTSTTATTTSSSTNTAGAATASTATTSSGMYSIDANGNILDANGNIFKNANEIKYDNAGNIMDMSGNILVKAGGYVKGAAAGAASTATDMAGDASNLVAYKLDTNGNLVDEAGTIFMKAGEFDTDAEGYYVDKKGNRIGRMLGKVGKAIAKAAGATADAFKNTFSGLFKKKKSGESVSTYALSDIEFDPKSHKISNFSKEEVEGLAAALKANPEAKIQVQSFTNDGGNKMKNKTISSMRAELVTQMLTTLGVDKGQISSKGMSTKDDAKAAKNAIEILVD